MQGWGSCDLGSTPSAPKIKFRMDNIFLLKLLISFLAGSIWVILTTVIADKYGDKIAGLIAGLPSITIFILLFLALVQGPIFAVKVTSVTPIMAGIESLFLIVFCFISIKNSFKKSLVSALVVWFLLATLTYFLHFENYSISLISFVVLFLISYLLMKKIPSLELSQKKKIIYTPKIILCRGLGGGMVVALAILMGKIGGPALAGIFPGFPAIITSTLIITFYAHGLEFSRAISKNALLGIVGLVIYSIIVRYTYLPLGIFIGTLLSIFISFFSGYLFLIAQKK